ncbi:MAG: bifunctional demethylmenaquinone methyltransferase/2-methoxy-6-polyprenyl-1,4-benzoquinol methylase UbiE [Bacteroidia bacterium]|nr:bifunctional demethylmenaquinone methyltransferase/2-methoxy-6-polyprenyl-1,4-benzoquinol methylase UbiE [Bacteroidia bacterium]MCZ2276454.1 bifunctional demethylmenaquinone methyltransferase/2-methoxy-6-polyprenyl-1,4-benzoquinol methylase UbiE [Bacteroidia bacterium]
MPTILPYKNQKSSKQNQVEQMFDSIAHRYDFLNHLLSLGIDKKWRKAVANELRKSRPAVILDVATGTGDLAFTLASELQAEITGIDLSANMLEQARQKKNKFYPEKKIRFVLADAGAIPFPDHSFDTCTVAFGVRNFETISSGLQEMNRVLCINGTLAILEFSIPEHFLTRQCYLLYFRYILPAIGRFFSKDKNAYGYLPESVSAFPAPALFIEQLQQCGFSNIRHRYLTFGIVSLYTAQKL